MSSVPDNVFLPPTPARHVVLSRRPRLQAHHHPCTTDSAPDQGDGIASVLPSPIGERLHRRATHVSRFIQYGTDLRGSFIGFNQTSANHTPRIHLLSDGAPSRCKA